MRRACLASFVVFVGPFVAAGEERVTLGILPTADTSADPGTASLAKALPMLIFDRLNTAQLEPVLLNPGGQYAPQEEEWYLEYARSVRVDAVFVSTLSRDHREKADAKLQGYVQDVRNGRRSAMLTASIRLDRNQLERAAYYDGAAFFGRNKDFEKTKVGKAAKKLAETLIPQVDSATRDLQLAGTAPPPPATSGRCDFRIRVRFADRGAASKTYILVLNGREESLGIRDGVATVTAPAGRLVLHASVRDAPFRLPIQESYSANTYLECGATERSLILQIGAVGEAFVEWH